MTPPRILIIAGSDSGGGAGIQADIKTVTMLGGHAMTAITAVTAQNTLGVSDVHAIPTDMVLAQIDTVIDDIGVDAIKIGMIGSFRTARALAEPDQNFGTIVGRLRSTIAKLERSFQHGRRLLHLPQLIQPLDFTIHHLCM